MTNTLALQHDELQARPLAGAIPIDIRYSPFVETFVSRTDEEDTIFSEWREPLFWKEGVPQVPDQVGVPQIDRQRVDLDPYRIRAAFEAARTEEQIRNFLSQAGPFWRFASIRRSHFEEWQTLVRLVRLNDWRTLGEADPEVREAFSALNGFPSKRFRFDHPRDKASIESAIARTPESFRAGLRESFRETAAWRERELRSLLEYLANPTAYVSASYTPEAMERIQREGQGPSWPPEKDDTMPVLSFYPKNALEAIAATIAADRLQGILYRKCFRLTCQKLVSGSKRDYCSDECKDAARTERRTKEEREAKAAYLRMRHAGLNVEDSKSAAEREGHSVTERIIERSEKMLAKQKKPMQMSEAID